jgi:aspartate/glutamate racemase
VGPLPESRNAILAIIERLRAEERVEAILLAGTELPLLLRDAEPGDIPLLDATVIHVGAAVEAFVR